MTKNLVDFVGGWLFAENDHSGSESICLKSEHQCKVSKDGYLEGWQSVPAMIVVRKDAISTTWSLPDGQELRCTRAVTHIDCIMNNDYSVRSIIYETESEEAASGWQKVLFILQCEDDQVMMVGEQDTAKGNRIFFEIS